MLPAGSAPAPSASGDAAEAARVAAAKAGEDALERAAFLKIVRAMRGYAVDAADEVRRWEHNFSRLPPAHQSLLQHHTKKHMQAYACIRANETFFTELLTSFSGDDVPPHLRVPEAARDPEAHAPVSPGDAEKVRYVLKNLARDWSSEAAEERSQSHGPILKELEERLYVPKDPALEGRYPPRVMVPGAGLGRLVLECARRGFDAEGNEHSYYMLLTSSFILNHCERNEQFTIHPFVHSNNNHTSDTHQMRAVAIPDVTARHCMHEATHRGGAMSMCAGDFVEVYGAPEHLNQWDAVATCFFIDTAHNVVEYLSIIARCLKPGGVWVNFGPLLFHWSDARSYLKEDELSVEMSLEDVEAVAQSVGLRIVKREMRDSLYTADKKSMCQTVYRCALLVAVREEK